MKFDLDALRRLSETNKPLVEQKRRQEEAYWKAKAETDRLAAEEAHFESLIRRLEFDVKWAAERGDSYAKLEDWTPIALGIFDRWWKTYPRTISKRYLPPVYQRVHDYCNSQGFKVRIELVKYYRGKTVYELRVYW